MKGYTDIRLFYLDIFILLLTFGGFGGAIWLMYFLASKLIPMYIPTIDMGIAKWIAIPTSVGVYYLYTELVILVIKKIKCNIVKSK